MTRLHSQWNNHLFGREYSWKNHLSIHLNIKRKVCQLQFLNETASDSSPLHQECLAICCPFYGQFWSDGCPANEVINEELWVPVFLQIKVICFLREKKKSKGRSSTFFKVYTEIWLNFAWTLFTFLWVEKHEKVGELHSLSKCEI